jgi:hypothetical protein
MRLPPIPGTIHKVGKVIAVKSGFTQTVIITQPVKKDNTGRVISREQFFVISVWSNKQTDSRFLKPEQVGIDCIADLYLDGQRWMGRRDLEYNHKLNLDRWVFEK